MNQMTDNKIGQNIHDANICDILKNSIFPLILSGSIEHDNYENNIEICMIFFIFSLIK